MKFIMHEALLDPCEKIMNCRQNPDVMSTGKMCLYTV